MDISNLCKNHSELIEHLKNNDYSKRYIEDIEREIAKLIALVRAGEIASYDDAFRNCESPNLTHNAIRSRKRILRVIMNFDVYGHKPDGSRKFTCSLCGNYNKLNPAYKAMVDCYAVKAKAGGLKDKTIRIRTDAAMLFFLALQQEGISRLADATQGKILKLLLSSKYNVFKESYPRQIKAVLKTCIREFPECEKVISFLPNIKCSRKNIPYLTDDEVAKIKRVLSEDSSLLPLRDKAIGTLALYTGLRSSDIAGLQIVNIDWEHDKISLVQQKTGVPLVIPLTATVGNAIYDYIKTERPETDCEHIFISTTHPFLNLGRSAMYSVSCRIMKAAGVRQGNSARKGLHMFRHNFATSLLGNNVPRPVITNLVGHASPMSLDKYLFSDFPHLKECALSITEFPVSKEVFGDE